VNAGLDLTTARAFATALLIGALIGLEREKHRTAESDGIGLRTFILVAQVGAMAGWLSLALGSAWVLAAALVGVAALVLASHVVIATSRPDAQGLTTEVAAVAVVLLGAMTTLGYGGPAVGLAVVTAAVLAFKQPLHGLVAKVGWDDVFAGLRLLVAAFIVLPLLPDRAVDPWGALNPASLWRLVLLISGLSLVGYVATRWLGPEKGTALTGLTGGLVSSTAVTLSLARSSRDAGRAGPASALAGGLLIAWAVMFARVVVLALVVNPAFAYRLLVPVVAMGVVTALLAWVYFRRSSVGHGDAVRSREVPLKNPFSLTAATKFTVLFAAVLLVVKVVERYFPGRGMYPVAALAGLTDVDAITLSMASYARTDAWVAVVAVVIAALSNTLVKAGMVVALGSAGLKRPVLLATAAIVVTGMGALALM